MRTLLATAGLVVAAHALSPAGDAGAQEWARPEILLFRETGFAGPYQRVTQAVERLGDMGLNDRVRSVRIVAGRWEVCEHAAFRGECQAFDADAADLARLGWGDRISSLRPLAPPARGEREHALITVFADVDFRGDARTFDRPWGDLALCRWAGRISSLKVSDGRWEACDRPDFAGRCAVFDGDVGNLRSVDFNDRIASLRPVRDEAPPRVARPGPAAVVLFDQPNFQGGQLRLEEPAPVLRAYRFNDRAVSVRVLGGAWQLCADDDFRGACRAVTGDVPDLGRLGLARTVSSLRPIAPHRHDRQGARLELFEHARFLGDLRTLTRPVPDLAALDFADVASSARVAGAWELCEAPGFSGHCVVVDGDLGDLRDVGMNDRVRSARPLD